MSGLYDPNEYEKAYEDYEKLMEIVRSKGYKKGWAFYVLKEKYGHCPEDFMLKGPQSYLLTGVRNEVKINDE